MNTTEDTNIMEPSEYVAIGKVPADAQVTVNDTGWSEHDKATMLVFGFDGVDMVEAWYS